MDSRFSIKSTHDSRPTVLGSIATRANDTGCTLFFADAYSAAKAHGHHNGTNHLPRRPFFDIPGGRSYEQLRTAADKAMREYIRDAGVELRGGQ